MVRNGYDSTSQLVKELLTKPKVGEIEVIHCRRNFPYTLKSPQWDPQWEGLKAVHRSGGIVFEIDPNYNLKIEIDNTCKIHKTPNNIKKLDRLCKEQVSKRKVRRLDSVTGQMVETEEVVMVAPEYERLEKSIIEEDMILRIAKMVEELRQAKPEPEPTVLNQAVVKQSVAPVPQAPVEPARHRGRPRKESVTAV